MKKQKLLWENQFLLLFTVYKDKKFDFIIKSPPASHFIREAAN
jgi:ribosomal protein L11